MCREKGTRLCSRKNFFGPPLSEFSGPVPGFEIIKIVYNIFHNRFSVIRV